MCFLLFPVLTYGQGGVCKLRGVMQVKNGKTFPYQLVLNVKGNEVTGYSQTKLFDGTEPKTTVTGTLNKKNNSLKLKESSADNAEGHSISCFASV